MQTMIKEEKDTLILLLEQMKEISVINLRATNNLIAFEKTLKRLEDKADILLWRTVPVETVK